MATVGLKQAEEIKAGMYKEDRPRRIVEYTNAWGGKAYGVTFARQEKINQLLSLENKIEAKKADDEIPF